MAATGAAPTEPLPQGGGPPHEADRYVSHLWSQIQFLHGEVERLEGQLRTARAKASSDSKQALRSFEQALEEKSAEIRVLKQAAGVATDDNLVTRCQKLEKQLASANAEISTLAMEKSDLFVKVQKHEAALKGRRSELQESQRSADAVNATTTDQVLKLNQTIQTMLQERTIMQKQIKHLKQKPTAHDASTCTTAPATAVGSTQTAAVVAERSDKQCQANDVAHFSDVNPQPAYTLAHALEQRTQEVDALRGQLDDISAIQSDTLAELDNAKMQLTETLDKENILREENESLLVQLRSLQRKLGEYASIERELTMKTHLADEEKQNLRTELALLRRDKIQWEEQMKQYETDISHLASNKNYANQQLSVLANENEKLRAEIQTGKQQESQLAFSLRAKETELQEVISAYQNAVAESASVADNQRLLERELDNVRATLASKEESVLYLQEQINGLHEREKQLILDLQSFEYENDQLHRRLLQCEAAAAQSDARGGDTQQLLLAKERIIEELHQSLAEVTKQVIVRENECMLLRRRCDALQTDAQRLDTALNTESARTQELQDSNARLIARDILAAAGQHPTLAQQLEEARAQLAGCYSTITSLTEKTDDDVSAKTKLEAELATAQRKLADVIEANNRLQRILVDQTKTLSSLSSE